jgi:hypothetical protein
MTTITAQEEITLRRKLGNGGRGFSTPDLDAIWVEAEESMSKAVWICFEELMNDAARFNDYTQNDTQEKRSQVFDHIANKLVPYWKNKVELEAAGSKAVRIYGLRAVPTRRVDLPTTDPDRIDDWRRRNG